MTDEEKSALDAKFIKEFDAAHRRRMLFTETTEVQFGVARMTPEEQLEEIHKKINEREQLKREIVAEVVKTICLNQHGSLDALLEALVAKRLDDNLKSHQAWRGSWICPQCHRPIESAEYCWNCNSRRPPE